MYDMDGINMLNAKVDSLVKIFGKLGTTNIVSNIILSYDWCGRTHTCSDCQQVEQVQFVSNFHRQHVGFEVWGMYVCFKILFSKYCSKI